MYIHPVPINLYHPQLFTESRAMIVMMLSKQAIAPAPLSLIRLHDFNRPKPMGMPTSRSASPPHTSRRHTARTSW
ncbi:hypothetical protein CCHR01_07189 [Colletotrichum chrysophilum]|uniref:Uncharacterized protein n=1 Tax=Colletotrichum chrysophilum TaxID=1836956 RepID=A0AAD9AP62_9PEZI|nr:hypothetical protein CCHR01_07189 [Colletotrichum chrysophilum]